MPAAMLIYQIIGLCRTASGGSPHRRRRANHSLTKPPNEGNEPALPVRKSPGTTVTQTHSQLRAGMDKLGIAEQSDSEIN